MLSGSAGAESDGLSSSARCCGRWRSWMKGLIKCVGLASLGGVRNKIAPGSWGAELHLPRRLWYVPVLLEQYLPKRLSYCYQKWHWWWMAAWFEWEGAPRLQDVARVTSRIFCCSCKHDYFVNVSIKILSKYHSNNRILPISVCWVFVCVLNSMLSHHLVAAHEPTKCRG